MNSPLCRGCSELIFNQYFLQIKEFSFHEECLVCYTCQVPLKNVCYLKNGQVFCKLDYDRQFRSKCHKCRAILYPEDLVIRNNHSKLIFHYSCFSCSTCGVSLQQGDEYFVRGGGCNGINEIMCKNHVGQQQQLCGDMDDLQKEDCSSSSEFLSEISRHRDGRRGPKRPRTILTAMQRRQFKASFEISPKPCRKVREALAKETGLSVRVVQVWFQNQRAKMKKMQRRGKVTTTPSPNDETSLVMADDFSEDSDDECLKNPESVIDEQTRHGGGGGGLKEDATNPIDKLYMMQDSYFSQN